MVKILRIQRLEHLATETLRFNYSLCLHVSIVQKRRDLKLLGKVVNDCTQLDLAIRLDTAWKTHTPIPPITESDGITDVAIAYAIQNHWTKMRLELD